MTTTETASLLELTADVVTAYVANNKVEVDAIASLIASTHAALAGIGHPSVEPELRPQGVTAAAIRRSVSEAGITSFIDGRTYQALKRHLNTHGLTPDAYRARYGLPMDYPIVAPAYAARRSALAKSFGLGKGGKQPKTAKLGKQTPKA